MWRKVLLVIPMLCISFTSLFAEKYAVVIGINDYESSRIRDLNYSEADARELSDALIKYARYKAENVRLLLGKDASYKNIKKEIYWLGEAAQANDKVFFYFSGHGTRVPDTDRNEEDGMDEAFCPAETDIDDPSTVILDDEIGHWFNRIQSKEIFIVLDCCHSGGAAGRGLQDDGSRGLDMAAAQSTGRGLLKQDANMYARDLTVDNKVIFTASDADEQSFENPKLGHGVFTYYLSEGIKGQADQNKDKDITTLELYNFTKDKTLSFAKAINQTQTPNKFGALDDAVFTEIENQLCDIMLYDRDLKLVGLGVGGNAVKPGDIFIVKKTQTGSRDLQIGDCDIFRIKIDKVNKDYCEGQIIQEYFSNLSIDPGSFRNYYAVKLQTGSVLINTQPWSTVILDGKEIGPTPFVLKDVPEGEHTLEFRIDVMGYSQPKPVKISVEANKKLTIKEQFTKK